MPRRRKNLYVTVNRAELAEMEQLKIEIAQCDAVIGHIRSARMMMKLDIELHKGAKARASKRYNALLKRQREVNNLKLKDRMQRPPGGPDMRGIRPVR